MRDYPVQKDYIWRWHSIWIFDISNPPPRQRTIFFKNFPVERGKFSRALRQRPLICLPIPAPWHYLGAPFPPLAVSPRYLLASHRVATTLEIEIMT